MERFIYAVCEIWPSWPRAALAVSLGLLWAVACNLSGWPTQGVDLIAVLGTMVMIGAGCGLALEPRCQWQINVEAVGAWAFLFGLGGYTGSGSGLTTGLSYLVAGGLLFWLAFLVTGIDFAVQLYRDSREAVTRD